MPMARKKKAATTKVKKTKPMESQPKKKAAAKPAPKGRARLGIRKDGTIVSVHGADWGNARELTDQEWVAKRKQIENMFAKLRALCPQSGLVRTNL